MSLFTSSWEKQLWLYAFIVLATIVSTLIFGQPLVEVFASQDLRAAIFLLVMALVGTTIVIHGIKTRPSRAEITIWLGLSAVYIMFFLRLGMPERSHLMEYSVLAIFIHMALIERIGQESKVLKPALLALTATFIIGLLDECVQIFLPDRVFDPNDIAFNGFSGLMAIGSRMLLQWIRKKTRKA
ncbi:MAG: VanZ family protein [Maribacter sp.]|nr:VanZ family protein [Maribacter sp.]